MLIADAQVHIWGPSTPERPWRPGWKAHRAAPLGADEMLEEMNGAGVDRCVLIPPYWEGCGNDVVLEAARRHPDRFAAMGRIDVETPLPPGTVAKWREQPGMLGFRCSFIRPPVDDALVHGGMDWLWGDAEQAGVPIYVLVYHDLVHLIDTIAQRFPKLKLVLNHLGLESGAKDENAFKDLDKLLALAKRPNVAVAASALPFYTQDKYPYKSLHPYLRRVYDAYGAQRMFWGTDYQRLRCTYKQAVTMFTQEIPWLTARDKEWIMGRGLCEWLDWPLPSR